MTAAVKRILVADDDPAIVDAIKIMLEDEGYQVETTVDGATLHEAQAAYPDILLLDIWMSGSDGRDICKYLKSQLHTRHIHIIMISANKDTAKLAREAGADDFLEKPFERDELLAKVSAFG